MKPLWRHVVLFAIQRNLEYDVLRTVYHILGVVKIVYECLARLNGSFIKLRVNTAKNSTGTLV